MRTRGKVIAATFTVLQALAALGLVALSVHGPSGLIAAAPVYFVVAAGATWWAARRATGLGTLLVVGALALAAAPGVITLLAGIETLAFDRRIAATRVTDVRDEPIISSSTGRPIGVRLRYRVTVPARGYFGVLPSLHATGARSERLSLRAVRWTIDGSSTPTAFEPGRVHAVDVELYPGPLAVERGVRCLAPLPIPSLPEGVLPAPLRVMISESTYGDVFRGGREETTTGSYDLAELYRAVLAEGLAPCAVAG